MKLVRLAGIGEIILAAILGVGAYFGINNQKPLLEQIYSNEFNMKTMGILVAVLLVIRLLVGLIGLIGKGRGLCVVSGLILLAMSAPDVISWTRGEAGFFQIILQGLAILMALLFLIGAFFVGRKPKVTAEAEVALEGAAPSDGNPVTADIADISPAPVVATTDMASNATTSTQTLADIVINSAPNMAVPIEDTTLETVAPVVDNTQITVDALQDIQNNAGKVTTAMQDTPHETVAPATDATGDVS